jgi:quercetin 2,3-dioxygenase
METVNGKECSAVGATQPTFIGYPNRNARLVDLGISRALPIRERRMVGPWCFLDRFGPLSFTSNKPMNVPPHPHIGLQTVSWLLEGEVLHNDSLGSEALVSPGGVNIMTAGNGISHSEETPAVNSGHLSGVQLWVALPDSARNMAPSFTHVEQVPVVDTPGGILQVFAGTKNGATSPAAYYSEIVGLDVQIHAGSEFELDLDSGFEHALLVLSGDCNFEQTELEERMLYYLGSGRSSVSITSRAGSRVLFIGGPPFPETILMWWNFVARTPEELSQARADWVAQRRFGQVAGEHGARLAAPDLMRFARPNPAS